MKIIFGLQGIENKLRREAVAPRGTVATLGIFDGVHLGHQKILKKLVQRGKATGYKTLVLTFSPHPSALVHPGEAPPLLTSLEKRLELLDSLGVEISLVINFTRAFSRIRAREFVSTIMVKKLSLRELVVSTDFTFGYRAEGDIEFLSRLSKEEGFGLFKIKPVYKGGEIISSSRLRKVIQQGDLIEAEKLLGRPYSLTGTVMKGYRRGRHLGFPTANIRPHHEVLPPRGVYYGLVIYQGRKFGALANFGFRPTFYGQEKSFEVHIFDFYKYIYHEQLEFIFKGYLRPEKVFTKEQALIRQINRDKEKALALLK